MRAKLNILAAVLGLLLAPLAQAAEVPVPASPADGYTLRLLGDGDWIAAVKDDVTSAQPGALLIAPTSTQPEFGAGGAGIGIGGFIEIGGGRLYGGADQVVSIPVASSANPSPVWCGGITALMSAAGLADDCVAPGGPSRLPELSRTQLTMGYTLDGADLRLVYGDTATPAGNDWLILPSDGVNFIGSAQAISFVLPGANGAFPSRDLTLSGSVPLGRFGDLTLAAGYAQLRPYGTTSSALSAFPISPMDQTALRVGLRRGAFSGAITGRVVRADNDASAGAWTGLDLGISWRTPWSAEISFGAENLLGRGNNALLPTPPDADSSESAARTPYVRYRQDL